MLNEERALHIVLYEGIDESIGPVSAFKGHYARLSSMLNFPLGQRALEESMLHHYDICMDLKVAYRLSKDGKVFNLKPSSN